jgi:DNA polymerase III gamma/tau subunit
MSLYNKYRPQSLDDVFGNRSTIRTLQGTLKKPDPPHAYLFHGPTGCGKTTLSRILARELGATGNDYREIDSADFRGIDMVRNLREQANFRPLEGGVRVWLLDECHKMTNDAQNALLKILEDPPEHVYFILATTDPEKLLSTIRGRCSQFPVAPLSEVEMRRLLSEVAKAEDESITRPVYETIIDESFGRPRDALQMLEQVLSSDAEDREEVIKQVKAFDGQVKDLCRALKKPGTPWSEVRHLLKNLENEGVERVRRAVLGYMKAVLLSGEDDMAGLVMEEFIHPFYDSGFPELVFACYRIIRQEI